MDLHSRRVDPGASVYLLLFLLAIFFYLPLEIKMPFNERSVFPHNI